MKINVSFLLLKALIVLQYLNLVADCFPSYFQMIVFIFWLIVMFAQKEKILNRCAYLSWFSFVFFAFVLLRCVSANMLDLSYFSPMNAAIGRYQLFAYLTLFPYVITLNKKQKKQIFDLTLACMAITVIVSLYYILFVDPQAIRNTQGVDYFGVGDFLLMYGMAMLMGPLLALIIAKRKKHEKPVLYFIVFCLMLLCLILCNLVTSLVIAIISIAVTVFLTQGRRVWQLTVGMLAIVVVALKSVWASMLRKIASSEIFYWTMNNKLIAIANVLQGDFENVDTLSLRVELSMIGLNSFKQNALFGIDFRNHKSGVIGGHAQWTDDLARYGIIGNLFLVLYYIFAAKYTVRQCKSSFVKHLMISEWIVFLILGFLNPCLSGTVLMVMFVVVPSLEFYFDE